MDPTFEAPIIELPNSIPLTTISIPLPTADVPSYTPMVVPPSDLQAEEEPEGSASEEPESPGMRKVDIPFTDKQMPVPETEILVTATTTAVVSVAATLTATAAFKYCLLYTSPSPRDKRQSRMPSSA